MALAAPLPTVEGFKIKNHMKIFFGVSKVHPKKTQKIEHLSTKEQKKCQSVLLSGWTTFDAVFFRALFASGKILRSKSELTSYEAAYQKRGWNIGPNK